MKKFGFGKKKGDDVVAEKRVDDNYGASNPNQYARQNPYAQQNDSSYQSNMRNPYADSAPPPAYGNGRNDTTDRYRQEKTPVPQGGYGGYPNQRPANNKSYGSRPYGGGLPSGPAGGLPSGPRQSQQRQGGYGGFEEQKQELFQGSEDRVRKQQQQNQGPAPGSGGSYGGGYGGGYGRRPGASEQDPNREELFGRKPDQERTQYGGYSSGNGQYGGSGGYAGYGGQGYGKYVDQPELTPEEQEAQDVQAMYDEARERNKDTVRTGHRALQLMDQAIGTGERSLQSLANQGDRLYNLENNLNETEAQNKVADKNTDTLRRLNNSMWSQAGKNAPKPGSKEERMIMKTREEERMRRENMGNERDARRRDLEMPDGPSPQGGRRRDLVGRNKFRMDDQHSSDDEREDEIEDIQELMMQRSRQMKGIATAMGKEVDSQNKHLDRIGKKVDSVDDGIARNRVRLDNIK